ncbi:hypothetical protein H6H01_09255 [Nostoc calcicola FACHB-3891]|nr:hypothetical protein [Nostoc calcicola FACHB-3891]MDZ8061566.1 hypothetical protein [Nostoc sp. EkiNYC01]
MPFTPQLPHTRYCGLDKTLRNCDDYARIVKGSLQNLPIAPNSVTKA